MRFNALYLCLIAAEIYQVWGMLPREMSKTIHRNCQRDVGTTDKDIADARQGTFHMDNSKQTCYLKCVLKEVNVMNDQGKLTPLNAIKLLPPPVLLKMGPIVGACGTIDDPNPCLKATKLYQCVYDKFPHLYEVP